VRLQQPFTAGLNRLAACGSTSIADGLLGPPMRFGIPSGNHADSGWSGLNALAGSTLRSRPSHDQRSPAVRAHSGCRPRLHRGRLQRQVSRPAQPVSPDFLRPKRIGLVRDVVPHGLRAALVI